MRRADPTNEFRVSRGEEETEAVSADPVNKKTARPAAQLTNLQAICATRGQEKKKALFNLSAKQN